MTEGNIWRNHCNASHIFRARFWEEMRSGGKTFTWNWMFKGQNCNNIFHCASKNWPMHLMRGPFWANKHCVLVLVHCPYGTLFSRSFNLHVHFVLSASDEKKQHLKLDKVWTFALCMPFVWILCTAVRWLRLTASYPNHYKCRKFNRNCHHMKHVTKLPLNFIYWPQGRFSPWGRYISAKFSQRKCRLFRKFIKMCLWTCFSDAFLCSQ